MRNLTLPVMTVMTVISGAVGLQIGESAIAQIDPLYFQGPAPAPIDVSRNARPAGPNAYAEASGWEEGQAARAQDCPDCGAASSGVYATSRSDSLPGPTPGSAERAPIEQAELVIEEAPFERSAESQRVRRYLDYPVSADQARIRAALEAEAEAAAPAGF